MRRACFLFASALAQPLAASYIPCESEACSMAMTAQEIEDLIRAEFPNAEITIKDLRGDGNHYAAEVVDISFQGKNRVQQQRSVYAALKGKMDGPRGDLHALALTTKAPEVKF